MNLPSKSAVLVLLSFAILPLSFGVEFQAGVRGGSLDWSSNKSSGGGNFRIPFVALGGEIVSRTFLFIESEVQDWEIDYVGEFGYQEGVIEMTGRSACLVLVPRFERLDFRLGWGKIFFESKFTPSPQLISFWQGVNFTNGKREIKNNEAEQSFIGIDFHFGKNFSIGVEDRHVNFPNALVETGLNGGVMPRRTEIETNLSHRMRSVRVLLRF